MSTSKKVKMSRKGVPKEEKVEKEEEKKRGGKKARPTPPQEEVEVEVEEEEAQVIVIDPEEDVEVEEEARCSKCDVLLAAVADGYICHDPTKCDVGFTTPKKKKNETGEKKCPPAPLSKMMKEKEEEDEEWEQAIKEEADWDAQNALFREFVKDLLLKEPELTAVPLTLKDKEGNALLKAANEKRYKTIMARWAVHQKEMERKQQLDKVREKIQEAAYDREERTWKGDEDIRQGGPLRKEVGEDKWTQAVANALSHAHLLEPAYVTDEGVLRERVGMWIITAVPTSIDTLLIRLRHLWTHQLVFSASVKVAWKEARMGTYMVGGFTDSAFYNTDHLSGIVAALAQVNHQLAGDAYWLYFQALVGKALHQRVEELCTEESDS